MLAQQTLSLMIGEDCLQRHKSDSQPPESSAPVEIFYGEGVFSIPPCLLALTLPTSPFPQSSSDPSSDASSDPSSDASDSTSSSLSDGSEEGPSESLSSSRVRHKGDV